MFGQNAASEYHQVGIRHEIENASPHRLIQMLMEGVLTKVARAKASMEGGLVAEKGRLITDATNIISCLQASLNHDADKRLSGNFDALYDYMMRRLLESNLKNESGGLDEVAGLMGEVKMAWDIIGDKLHPAADKPAGYA